MSDEAQIHSLPGSLLSIEGLYLASFLAIDPASECYVGAADSSHGNRGFAFYYHDKRHDFFFYADTKWDGQSYDVLIKEAACSRSGAKTPEILPVELPNILERITLFFQQRDFLQPSKLRKTSAAFRRVILEWQPSLPR